MVNYKWYFYSILGLLLIGAGLCVFGEALIQKINQESYFVLGTLSLVIFNAGICFVGEAIFIRRKQSGFQ
tara:strand:- start:177 stop:386 length:210 start_codon:yes stop_codon:yes gene_type:complete